MSKVKNKTQPTRLSISLYLKSIKEDSSRQEAKILIKLFKEVTKFSPVLWGNMVGFGKYHYIYQSGREGDFFATGFAMRKSGPVIYIMPGYKDYSDIMKNLGPYKLGQSCLYLKNLDDINLTVLKRLIKTGLKDLNKKYKVVSK